MDVSTRAGKVSFSVLRGTLVRVVDVDGTKRLRIVQKTVFKDGSAELLLELDVSQSFVAAVGVSLFMLCLPFFSRPVILHSSRSLASMAGDPRPPRGRPPRMNEKT
jgi:hypothetical protein